MSSSPWAQVQMKVTAAIRTALETAVADGSLRLETLPEITIEQPEEKAHGDLACPVALGLARQAKLPPRKIAEILLAHLTLPREIASTDIAGPGFLNFFLSNTWLEEALRQILDSVVFYGRTNQNAGKKAQVEFVSANPTGPLTLGHGRQAVIGDTVARLLQATGYEVVREYFFNNAGRQMAVLGASTQARYLEHLGKPFEFPEDGYQGEYIRDIARQLVWERGEELVETTDLSPFTDRAVEAIFEDIRKTLARMGIVFDMYYNENSLYDTGKVRETLALLERSGHTYEQDGAVWFKATEFGLPQDRVLVRSTGDKLPTYRVPDIAYHRDKLERGFDLIVDIFGADHIAEYPDVLAGVKALGFDTEKIVVLIHQFVTITKGGETVKMSTRKANFVTVDELMDEVGEDAVRFFFIFRSMNSHLNFDIELAKKATSENPLYYLQYAHARIAGIFRQASNQNLIPVKLPAGFAIESSEPTEAKRRTNRKDVTILTYSRLSEPIRSFLSRQPDALELRLEPGHFSKKSMGCCPVCNGQGVLPGKYGFAPAGCPACGGTGFDPKILEVRLRGYTIAEILNLPVAEVIDLFRGSARIHLTLKFLIQQGLGHRSLGERLIDLSESDYAAISRARALQFQPVWQWLAEARYSLLTAYDEVALIKKLGEFPDVVLRSATDFEPHRIPHYLQEVATLFHAFYDRCRVLDPANMAQTRARLALSRAAQIVLSNGLHFLGVRAPGQM